MDHPDSRRARRPAKELTRPRSSITASRSAWPSSPPSNIFRPASGPRSSSARCSVGRSPRRLSCSNTSVPAINSALQRARSTLRTLPEGDRAEPLDAADSELLARYVDAFERYDVDRLVTLLREDAVQSMPPFAMWIQGAADIGRFMVEPGPSQCRGSRLLATSANGCPAFGQYKPDPQGGYIPWALQVLEISGGAITGMQFFLSPLDPERLFPSFGLPLHLDA